MDIAEEVYASLLGLTAEEARLAWVNNIFIPGKDCYEAYNSMLHAYCRVLPRLGKDEDDKDLEDMVNSLLAYSRAAALEMFRYGRQYQTMLDSSQGFSQL